MFPNKKKRYKKTMVATIFPNGKKNAMATRSPKGKKKNNHLI
jgi:hypothetical protein